MKKFSVVLILLFLQFGCQSHQLVSEKPENIDSAQQTIAANRISNSPNENISSETPSDEEPYRGLTIDQIFPIIEKHDFMEENLKEKTYFVKADDFQIKFKSFAPQTIGTNKKPVFDFQTINLTEDYWSNLVGISHLLGQTSKEIYVVSTGPGAVCCTNYWITDVSNKRMPRNVFRSEDFGSFRDAMEIFDADGDGIYELVQFDSTFRYFMGDCGSCSPEPRAVFKYDKKKGTYLPAAGVQQPFVKEAFDEIGKWLAEKFKRLEKETNPALLYEYNQRSLAYVVDLFYLGEERKAWKVFDNYIGDEKMRVEIKKRLKESKFYQALKRSS